MELEPIRPLEYIMPHDPVPQRILNASRWFIVEVLELDFGDYVGRPSQQAVIRVQLLSYLFSNGWYVDAVQGGGEGGNWRSVSDTATDNGGGTTSTTTTNNVTSGQTTSTTNGQTTSTTVGQTTSTTVGQTQNTTVGQTQSTTVGQTQSTTVGQTTNSTSGQTSSTTRGSGNGTSRGSSSGESSSKSKSSSQSGASSSQNFNGQVYANSSGKAEAESTGKASSKTEEQTTSTQNSQQQGTQNTTQNGSQNTTQNGSQNTTQNGSQNTQQQGTQNTNQQGTSVTTTTTDGTGVSKTESEGPYWYAYVRIRLKRRKLQAELVMKDMVEDLTKAYNEGRKINDDRYDELVNLYSLMLGRTENEGNDFMRATTDFKPLTDYVLLTMKKTVTDFHAVADNLPDDVFKNRVKEINLKFDNQLSKARSELITAGLFNSTVWPTTASGIERNREMALNALIETKIDVYVKVAGAAGDIGQKFTDAAARLQQMAKERMLDPEKARNEVFKWMLDFMERRKDEFPGMDQIAGAVKQLGYAETTTSNGVK